MDVCTIGKRAIARLLVVVINMSQATRWQIPFPEKEMYFRTLVFLPYVGNVINELERRFD